MEFKDAINNIGGENDLLIGKLWLRIQICDYSNIIKIYKDEYLISLNLLRV